MEIDIRSDYMENWNVVFDGIIPQDNYQTQITNGEYKGLIIELESNDHHVIMDFGVVKAIRMLDEGIVQNELYLDSEVEKFKKDGFKNVIYEIKEGQFLREIQNISGGYCEALNVKHYIVITQNYNIEIITEWEPEINVL